MFNLFDEKNLDPWGFGVHVAITEEDYHKIIAVSQTGIKVAMEQSMRHFLTLLTEGFEGTSEQLKGRLLHKAFLEPNWCKENMIFTEIAGKNLTPYKLLVQQFPTKMILNKAESELVQGAMRVLNDDAINDKIKKLFSDGRTEVSAFAKDPDTGLILKMRCDFLTNAEGEAGFIVDYKTTQNAAPPSEIILDEFPAYSDFGKSALTYKYHMQGAFYRYVLRLNGLNKDHFMIVAQEKEPPYEFTIRNINEAWLDKGEELFKSGLKKIAQKALANNWEGYERRVFDLDFPHYGFDKTW
jgi:hypothetical protein